MDLSLEKLIVDFKPIVESTVDSCMRRFPWRGSFDKSDLISVAFLTLIKCVKNFNPQRGEFECYVRSSIRSAVLAEMIRGISIRVPRHAYRKIKNGSLSYKARYGFSDSAIGFMKSQSIEEDSSSDDNTSVLDLLLSLGEVERWVLCHSFGVSDLEILADSNMASRLAISEKEVTKIRMLALAKMRELLSDFKCKERK